MQYLLFTGSNGYTSIYGPLTTQQTEDLITQFELAAGSYAIVSSLSSLPTGWESYRWGVTFASPSTVGYDFSLAQLEAKNKAAVTFLNETNNAVTLVPPFMLSSQMALPEVDRLPIVNQTINTLNVIANDMQSTYDAIDAATTLAQLDAINNPPAISGAITLDRDGLALDMSFFTVLNGVSAAETYLVIPATATTIPWDAENGSFSSFGEAVFLSGQYQVQLKTGSTTIATFNLTTEVPTSYTFSVAPPAPPD